MENLVQTGSGGSVATINQDLPQKRPTGRPKGSTITPLIPPKEIVVKRGRGRPKGTIDPHTKLKIRAEKNFRFRVYKMTDKLLNSQLVTALGTHKVVTVEIDEEGKKHIKMVNEVSRIEKLLTEGVYGKDYLIIEGTPADWKAANAILDRAFGKAKESISLDVDVKFSLKDLAERRVALSKENDENLLPEKPRVIEGTAKEKEPSATPSASIVEGPSAL